MGEEAGCKMNGVVALGCLGIGCSPIAMQWSCNGNREMDVVASETSERVVFLSSISMYLN